MPSVEKITTKRGWLSCYKVGRNAPLQLRYLIGDILQLHHYAFVQDTLFLMMHAIRMLV